jgi:hypothetical protein
MCGLITRSSRTLINDHGRAASRHHRANQVIGDARAHVVPALIAAAGERASPSFLEFFAANIRNPQTRRAVKEFMTWCDEELRYSGEGGTAGEPCQHVHEAMKQFDAAGARS